MQLCACGQDEVQRVQVEVVGEDLDDDVHEVLLRNGILAVDDLLEDGWENHLLVQLERHAIELTEPHEVRADENAQLATLRLALLALARVAEMLLPDPQPVHLDKVREHEADAVGQVAGRPGLGACRQVITGRGREVVAQKEAARRVLYAAAHFRHVLHNLPDGRVGHGHVHAADGDHEVEARHNMAAVLHELVEVGEVVLSTGMRIVQVDREVAQCIQHGHVQLVVVLRREARGAQLAEHRRRALEGVHDVVHVQVALELHALDLDDAERLGECLG